MLQRLREQRYQHLHANLSQRSMSSFSLQREEVPVEARDHIAMVVYPQNPFVGEPEVRRMSRRDVGSGLINARFQVDDSLSAQAQPDEEGNYIYWPGDPEFDQVSAFYYATFTLRMYERCARRAIPWAFLTPRLRIDPHVGDRANAFYSERDSLLGFHRFPLDERAMRSTAQSADVVSHETAHAVLDGLRDLYNESFGLGARAFHESFGDMTAVLVALYDDSLIHRLLEWTDGDLRTTNFVSEVAEHLTRSLQSEDEHLREHTVYLRNAFNTLRYIPFDELPYRPENPENQLSRQAHNYSRLFTGAFYDILVSVYELLRGEMPPYLALYRARNSMASLLIRAIELGPVGEFDFSDMALAFLVADQVHNGGRYAAAIREVFTTRGILSSEQAEERLRKLAELPDLWLPDRLSSGLHASAFLEQQVLPTLQIEPEQELIPLNAYRNADGYAYMTFCNSFDARLTGAQDGSDMAVEVFGGLSLVFDPADRLCSVVYRPVTDEDVRQIRVSVADWIQQGLITDAAALSTSTPVPHGLLLPDRPGRLIRYPALYDDIHENATSFLSYLHQW